MSVMRQLKQMMEQTMVLWGHKPENVKIARVNIGTSGFKVTVDDKEEIEKTKEESEKTKEESEKTKE